ncbi:aminotransferase class IV [Paenibacillus sp. GCM10027626]|uniref:aminotransferase class IV n=1 Tax=Paenibacillus sp. GCM10027626 TaxID=3273411 RepID=UPI00362D397B
MNYIGWNGSVVKAEEAVVSVFDHGFLYGMGLFETFRTYGGRPYLLERHLKRLGDGCRQLGIIYPAEDQSNIERLKEWIAQLMTANELEEAYIRLTITAGEAGLGLPAADYEAPNEVLLAKPLPSADPMLYQTGKQLALLNTRRNTPEGEVRLKSLHYMNNLLAKRELLQSGAAPGAEGLMLTGEGWLAEGIVSNLFFARSGVIYTPAIQTGILPGITRERVIELARSEQRFAVEEGLYTWDDLLLADEVWLTTSIQELVPVTSLRHQDGTVTEIGAGGAGAITLCLLEAYRQDHL